MHTRRGRFVAKDVIGSGEEDIRRMVEDGHPALPLLYLSNVYATLAKDYWGKSRESYMKASKATLQAYRAAQSLEF